MNGLLTRFSDFWATLQFGAGNCGVTVSTDNAVAGSLELKAAALGNGVARPWWRALLQIYGGVEIQNASNEDFTDGFSVIALGPQRNTSLGIATEGINIDVNNLSGAVCFRGPEDAVGNRPVLGKIQLVSDGVDGFQMIFSVRDASGVMRDCQVLGPSLDPSGALVLLVDEAQHRLRRVWVPSLGLHVATVE